MKKMAAILAGAMLMMATSAWAIPLPWLDYVGTIAVSNVGATLNQNIHATGGVYLDGTSFSTFDTPDAILGNHLIFGDIPTVPPTFLLSGGSISGIADTTVHIKDGSGNDLFFANLVNIAYVPASSTSGTVNAGYSANLQDVTVKNTINSRWLTEIALVAGAPDYLASQSIFIGFSDDLLTNGNGTVNVSGKIAPAPVPEPGTIILLSFGMLGLAIYGKRRMNKEA